MNTGGEMRRAKWLIYGATGFTGRLIAQEAVRRGHRPVLAARTPERLVPLADQLGLEHLVLDLSSPARLADSFSAYQAVIHTAGPFTHTFRPVLEACLLSHAHYIDITGELPVFEYIFNQDLSAQRKGITLLPGAGFDVVPSDCLAVHVASQIEDPVELAIAIAALGQSSAGTRKSMLEMLAQGGQVRRSGRLMGYPIGLDARRVRFTDRSRIVLPVPWGDLSTAYRSTGIPNITTYLAFKPGAVRLARYFGRMAVSLMKMPGLRRWLQSRQGAGGQGPGLEAMQSGGAQVYARAVNSDGKVAQAWLETMDAYQLTAISAVSCLEEVLENPRSGAFSPAQILGPNWVLQLEKTRRLDSLPERPSQPLSAAKAL